MLKKVNAACFIVVLILCLSSSLHAKRGLVRIKDIARVYGVRDNQLIGQGIVVGLNGTGDKVVISTQMVTNMLKRFGLSTTQKNLNLKNVAVVAVSATLPAFAKEGDKIDVQVSSLSDAKSLKGGILLQTPLTAADGKVYAVAQGPVQVNVAKGRGARNQSSLTTGIIPDGAIVEREVRFDFVDNGDIKLILNSKDFVTASRIKRAINKKFSAHFAKCLDAGTISVKVPMTFLDDPVSFISIIENVEVVPDEKAVVVINARTGTIVMGENVKITPVVLSHSGVSISIDEKVKHNVFSLNGNVRISDIVKGLNAIGVKPQDLIAILQALKEAGALKAELKVM